MKNVFLLCVCLSLACHAGGAVPTDLPASDPLQGVLSGKGSALPEGYVPPILSNGELSMALDWTCGMRPKKGGYFRLQPGVYLAGRRHSAPNWQLFDFAKLNATVRIDGRVCEIPDAWSQTLDVRRGLQRFRHCPDFRFKTLPEAEMRVGHYGRNGGRDGAQWMWETVETGVTEGCPVGFWQQHYFHMPTICRTAWTQYLYSDDLSWLRERGYPVIAGCARFFSKNMIYRNPDGSVYLGKCTDLERLGPSRENAFMTTVGAVYAMRVFADASDLLGANRTEAGKALPVVLTI